MIKRGATAVDVTVTDNQVVVALADGRELAAPLAWFPRLEDATADQRLNWRLIGRGTAFIGRTLTKTCLSKVC
jgi:hypothetical protein